MNKLTKVTFLSFKTRYTRWVILDQKRKSPEDIVLHKYLVLKQVKPISNSWPLWFWAHVKLTAPQYLLQELNPV